MQKVLIISYYWPPSGGAGVQRWLKLSKYLANLNLEIHVLTVKEDKASYLQVDESLANDVDERIMVHRTDSFEIINYYSSLVGKKNVPTSGFSNVDNTNWIQKLINSIRSHFFIPDPRIGWKKYAVKEALAIINKFQISTIITTSPPHSTQLIGLKLKEKTDVKWLVDFRDPWTDIYYYNLLNHSKISAKIDAKLERKVIEQCDKIITVSEGFKQLFLRKSNNIEASKIAVIPNGYDSTDFNTNKSIEAKKNELFTITYTGTMSLQYDPFSFFEILEQLSQKNHAIRLIMVGSVAEEIRAKLKEKSFEVKFVATVPHNEIHNYQQNANLLLLVIPDSESAIGITPGKLFEYIATKNQVLAIGPDGSDVNRILNECNSGKGFRRNQKDEMKLFITKLIEKHFVDEKIPVNEKIILKYSRKEQASQVAKLI